MRFRLHLLNAASVAAIAAGFAFPALAQTVTEPPAVKIGSAALVPLSTAQTFYGSSTTATTSSPFGRSDEVKELARALDYDPDKIFRFVRDNVALHPVFGSAKGPLGATLDLEGTAFDQAALAAELLRESNGKAGKSISANYLIGTATLTGTQFTAWTGFSDAKAACQFLADGGVPAAVNGSSDCATVSGAISSVAMGHAWLQVTVDGVTRTWDPSYKAATIHPGQNLAAVAGYTAGAAKAAVLSGATSGTQSGVPYVQNLNDANLRALIEQKTVALEAAFPAAGTPPKLIEVTGGLELKPSDPKSALVYAPLSYNAWIGPLAQIPDQYRASLTIAGFSSPIKLFSDEAYGRKLYVHTGDIKLSKFDAELKLDSQVLAAIHTTAPANETVRTIGFTLSLDHPYVAGGGSYLDRSLIRNAELISDAVFVLGMGRAGDGYVGRLERGLGLDANVPFVFRFIEGGPEDPPTGRRTDSTRIRLAAAWLRQFSEMADLQTRIGKAGYQHHATFGMVFAQTKIAENENAPYENDTTYSVGDESTQLDLWTSLSVRRWDSDETRRAAVLRSVTASAAGLEGSVVQQLMDLPDVASTATKFRWANAPATANADTDSGKYVGPYKFFLFDAGNVAQAANLITNDGHFGTVVSDPTYGQPRDRLITRVTSYVNGGQTVITSQDGMLGPGLRNGLRRPTGEMTGETLYASSIGYTRGGALVALAPDLSSIAHVLVHRDSISKGGGATAHPEEISELKAPTSESTRKERKGPAWSHNVDLATGTLTWASGPLLSAGPADSPNALTFERSFKSGHRAPDGKNWRHNWDFSAELSSAGLESMGVSRPGAAVPSLAAFMVMQDLYADAGATPADVITREVAGPLAAAWWAERLNHNVVNLELGNASARFVRRVKPAGDNGPEFIDLAASGATLVQGGVPTPRKFSGQTSRTWNYTPVTTFWYRDAGQNLVTFNQWISHYRDPWDPATAFPTFERHGWRAGSWNYADGRTTNFEYAFDACPVTGLEHPQCGKPRLTRVSNNFGWALEFEGEIDSPTKVTARGSDGSARVLTLGETFDVTPDGARTEYSFFSTQPQFGTGPGFVKLSLVYKAGDLDGTYGTDPSYRFEYDALDRVMFTVTPTGRSGPSAKTYAHWGYRIAAGRLSATVDPLGYMTTEIHDGFGKRVYQIDALGNLTSMTYDGLGRLVSRTYPELNKEQFSYDDRGNVVSKMTTAKPGSPEFGAPNTVTAGYDPTWNKLAWVRDAKGQQTDVTYYASGAGVSQVAQILRPAVGGVRPTTRFQYTPAGLLAQKVDPTGVTTTYGYDARGNRTSTTQAAAAVGGQPALDLLTQFTPNAFGDVAVTTDPRGNAATAQYDSMRRKVLEVGPDPDGAGPLLRPATRNVYNSVGHLVRVERGTATAADGSGFAVLETVSTEYDPAGNKIKETTPAGVTQFNYDRAYQPICTTVRMNPDAYAALSDACQLGSVGIFGADRITKTEYDPLGQPTKVTRGLGTAAEQVYSTHTYSANGLAKTIKDANGNLSTYEYDGFDRLAKLRFPDTTRGAGTSSPTDYEAYSYDANGNRTKVRKRDGLELVYEYDVLNRETLKRVPGTPVSPARDVYTEYDLAGRKRHVTFGGLMNTGDPAVATSCGTPGNWVAYCYDVAGRLIRETMAQVPLTYAYDAAGNRTRMTWSDGFFVDYDYDALNRATRVRQNGAVSGVDVLATYGYDQLGRRSSITRGNGTVTTYAYDAASRLTQLAHDLDLGGTANDQVFTFGYNPASQLRTRTASNDGYSWVVPDTAVRNYAADGLNREAAVVAASGYDQRGNQLTVGDRAISYDAENRLIGVGGGGALATAYDPLGRLFHSFNGAVLTQMLYDGARLSAEYDISLNLVRRYVHGPGVDEPLVWYEGAGTTDRRWLHTDRQGSVIAQTNAAGATTKTYSYGPYGEPGAGDWTGSRFRYTGQIALPEGRLYYYKARVYDPSIGRFLQTDPIGYKDDLNLYAYVANDPINATDPTGTKSLVGWVVRRVTGGLKEVKRIRSKAEAVKLMKAGQDVKMKSKQASKEVARAAGDGKKPITEKHKLKDGSEKMGSPHAHDGAREGGHAFWGAAAGAADEAAGAMDDVADEIGTWEDKLPENADGFARARAQVIDFVDPASNVADTLRSVSELVQELTPDQ